MFTSIQQLMVEAQRLAEAQPSEFQETLTYVTNNAIDQSILDLMDIVSNVNEQAFVTTTRI